MDRKLSLQRALALEAAPLARYLAPFLAQDAPFLFRDSYLKTILSSLMDEPGRPPMVRLAAGDLRNALLMGGGDSEGTELDAVVVRRATVLSETLRRSAGLEVLNISDAAHNRGESGPHGYHYRLPVVVWIPHLRSPFNVGNILRTCAGFGLAGVVLGESVPEVSHSRLQRAAMGATELIPIVRGGRTEAADLLGMTVAKTVALETGGTDITRYAFPERGIVVMGHEELGVPEEILTDCRRGGAVVTIPHDGPKSSLNVGVAAGICLSWWQARSATD